jgi:hypothetical protein
MDQDPNEPDGRSDRRPQDGAAGQAALPLVDDEPPDEVDVDELVDVVEVEDFSLLPDELVSLLVLVPVEESDVAVSEADEPERLSVR